MSGLVVAAGVLVAAAVAVALLPARRTGHLPSLSRAHRLADRADGMPGLAGEAWAGQGSEGDRLLGNEASDGVVLPGEEGRHGENGGPGGSWGGAVLTRVLRLGGRGREPIDIGVLLVSVAALLNAGATPQAAWSRSLGYLGIRSGAEIGDDAVPPLLLALAQPAPGWGSGRLLGMVRRRGAARGGQAEPETEPETDGPGAEAETGGPGASPRAESGGGLGTTETKGERTGTGQRLTTQVPARQEELASHREGTAPHGDRDPRLARPDGRTLVQAAGEALAQPADQTLARAQAQKQARALTRGLSRDRRAATACAVRAAAAACRLSARIGAPLAQTLEEVAAGVAEAGRAEAARRGALAGPQATARVLAALPLVGLALGAAVGARPQEMLLGGGAGSVLGVGGVVLMISGYVIAARMVRAAQERDEQVSEEVVVDLAAAALGAGASVPGTLVALGEALGETQLAIVGRCLLLGAGWGTAWQAPQDPDWLEGRRRLEQCLRPGWEDGAGVVGLLHQQARAIRDGRAARDEQAAARLAVRLVLPLGLCNLPAFLCLGVVPVVASLGSAVLAG